MFNRRRSEPTPTIETVRKQARILVIDDQEWPFQIIFERDGYHVERWAEIKTMSQLTDGHYQLILLDINGVGLVESPDLQGLGILESIKSTNPAQAVIMYSSRKQDISASKYLMRADAVMDKGMSYVDYKAKVDQLLLTSATPAYFVAAMNQQLADNAALAPRAVEKALKAMETGNIKKFARYIDESISDRDKVKILVGIISVGVQTVKALAA